VAPTSQVHEPSKFGVPRPLQVAAREYWQKGPLKPGPHWQVPEPLMPSRQVPPLPHDGQARQLGP
jgi:hypothetical protein